MYDFTMYFSNKRDKIGRATTLVSKQVSKNIYVRTASLTA